MPRKYVKSGQYSKTGRARTKYNNRVKMCSSSGTARCRSVVAKCRGSILHKLGRRAGRVKIALSAIQAGRAGLRDPWASRQ
jgi:hypothetical protein